MTQRILCSLCLLASLSLSACSPSDDDSVRPDDGRTYDDGLDIPETV